MPVCDCVLRCLSVALLSRTDGCAQRGLSKFVILPSGRSHLASLFGMSCISALLLGLLQRWCSLFVAQRWRNRCCTVSVVVLSTSCTNSVSRALLQVFFGRAE